MLLKVRLDIYYDDNNNPEAILIYVSPEIIHDFTA